MDLNTSVFFKDFIKEVKQTGQSFVTTPKNESHIARIYLVALAIFRITLIGFCYKHIGALYHASSLTCLLSTTVVFIIFSDLSTMIRNLTTHYTACPGTENKFGFGFRNSLHQKDPDKFYRVFHCAIQNTCCNAIFSLVRSSFNLIKNS